MYRTICTELWTDPTVRRLSVNGKLLFLYLITNPWTHLSGIYSLPFSTLVHYSGLTDRVSSASLDTLSKSGLAHWDDEREIVWVVNMFEYQGQGPKNEQAAANHLQTLHNSPLCERFLARYPKVVSYIKKIDRVKRESLPPSLRFAVLNRDKFSCQYCGATGRMVQLEVDHVVPVKDGGTNELTNLKTACLICNQGKGSDRVSDLEKSCPSVPVPVPDVSPIPDIQSNGHASEFDQFWLAYPKKVGKKEALKAWEKAKDKPDLAVMLAVLEDLKRSEQWTKDHGQFIPNPATWLNQGRWADEVAPPQPPQPSKPRSMVDLL